MTALNVNTRLLQDIHLYVFVASVCYLLSLKHFFAIHFASADYAQQENGVRLRSFDQIWQEDPASGVSFIGQRRPFPPPPTPTTTW